MVAGLAALVAAGSGVCRGSQTLDSVVASVGNTAVTASEMEQEYRFECFLNQQWPAPPPDAADLAAARQRLTYQILLTREENPGPTEKAASEKAAEDRLAALRKGYGSPERFQEVLKELRMTETEVQKRLAAQEMIMRLIDQRLRPEASPSDEAVAEYYRSTFVPDFEKKSSGAKPPALAQVDGQIREILTQKRINELLDQWIDELKPTAEVRFHKF